MTSVGLWSLASGHAILSPPGLLPQCPFHSWRLLGDACLPRGADAALLALSPGLWTFLWFVGFCFLTNQWAATQPGDVLVGADSARAAITFSFFSIFSWVGGPSGPGHCPW